MKDEGKKQEALRLMADVRLATKTFEGGRELVEVQLVGIYGEGERGGDLRAELDEGDGDLEMELQGLFLDEQPFNAAEQEPVNKINKPKATGQRHDMIAIGAAPPCPPPPTRISSTPSTP